MSHFRFVCWLFLGSLVVFNCVFFPQTCCAACLPAVVIQEEDADTDYRTWRDRQGNEIEAKFVEMEANQVKLEKKDGETITISIVKLSSADLHEAMKMTAQQKLGRFGMGNNGLGNNGLGNRGLGNRGLGISGKFDSPLNNRKATGPAPKLNRVEIDFGKARKLEANVAKWDLKREPLAVESDWDHNQSFSMALDGTHSDHVLIDPRDPSVGFVKGTSPLQPDTGFLFNTKAGRTVGPFTTNLADVKILAYDATTYRLLTYSERGGKDKLVDLWKVGSEGLKYQSSFSPYPPGTIIKQPVRYARFLDNDCVALTMAYQLAVYDLANRKGLYAIKFDLATRPQFGNDLDYFCGLVDGHVTAVDLRVGKVVAKSPVKLQTTSPQNRSATQQFSISPDMTRLVTMKQRYLEVFDLASGEKTESLMLPSVQELKPHFLDDENVLLINNMGGSLVNIRLRSAIWNYSGCRLTQGPLGSREVWVTADKPAGMKNIGSGEFCAFAMQIPSEKSAQIINSLELKDLIMLEPGDSVAIDLRKAGEGETVLVEQLNSIGIKIDPTSPTKLVARVGKGDTSSTVYKDATGRGSQTLVKTSEYFELALIKNGKKVWYFSGGSTSQDLGNLVVLSQGQTVQGKADAGRITPGQFFSSITLPKEFIKIPERGFYGRSRGNINGFEER